MSSTTTSNAGTETNYFDPSNRKFYNEIIINKGNNKNSNHINEDDLVSIIKDIINSDDRIFELIILDNKPNNNKIHCKYSKLLSYMIDEAIENMIFQYYFREINPYVKLFVELLKSNFINQECLKQRLSRNDNVQQLVSELNVWIYHLRIKANNSAFKLDVNTYYRQSNENNKALEGWINYWFHRYSKLIIIRVDLGYKKDWDNAYLTDTE